MSKHVHADLMAEYAKDAQTTNKPWLGWEYKGLESGFWQSCENSPAWWSHFEYRRKRKTHIVNGKEVAAPLDKLEKGQVVHTFSSVIVGRGRFGKYFTDYIDMWKDELARGLLFATREDAEENFNAHFPIRNI